MILNGREIKTGYQEGSIIIDPFDVDQVGPNSYDVRLGRFMKVIMPNMPFNPVDSYDSDLVKSGYIDPDYPQTFSTIDLNVAPYVMRPGELVLATTEEKIGSDRYVPMLEGRSSIGRMGLFIHVTAGFGDIGFKSNWTLELTSVLPIKISRGMRIGQVFFHTCTSEAMRYSGRYADQEEPQESLYWKNP
jgi:dCTP deaminase